jgi:hypothetical protein
MANKRITISLSPELLAQLEQKRLHMGSPPPSLPKAVIMLLQEQLGGQDQGYTLVVNPAGPLEAGPGKVVDFGGFSIKVPDDVELPPR